MEFRELAGLGEPRVAALNTFLCFLFLVAILCFPSCSVGDYLGAYFNTYYNAQRAFVEAEDEVLAQRGPQQDKAYLAPFVVPPNAKSKFTSVIEKCSKLLQYHAESSLVEDALLMIGKSYYYQNENQQAERKFMELLDRYPESDLALRARMLLANTSYRMNDLQRAEGMGRELIEMASSRSEAEIVGGSAMLLATINLDTKNIAEAQRYYRKAGENFEDQGDRFDAYRRAADMSLQLADYSSAMEDYIHARNAAPTYADEYRARIGVARMLSKVGQHEESLVELEDLLSNPNNRELFGEVDFEIANVYRDMGNIDAAVQQYRFVDTTYAHTEVSAKSYYELGLLYETRLFEYDSARVAYNKGRSEAPQATVTQVLNQRAEYLNKYSLLTNEILKNDSLKQLILFPPAIVDTLALRDSTRSDSSAISVTDSLSGNAPTNLSGHGNDSLIITESDSVVLTNSDTTMTSTPVDSLLAAESDSVVLTNGDSAMTSTHVDSLLAVASNSTLLRNNDSTTTSTPTDSLVQTTSTSGDSIKEVPRAVTVPLDTVEARLAQSKIELATLFYTSLNVTDSAAYWYGRLRSDHPSSIFIPRALYSLAQIASLDSSFSQQWSVDSLYHVILEKYPESEFAPAARKSLGLPPLEKKTDEAVGLYTHAEDLRTMGKNREAISAMSSIVKTYPESPIAPQAQYAIGWMYEEVTPESDSAFANYTRLVASYPGTEYAIRAKAKLDAVEQHLRDVKAQAARDSLERLNARQQRDSSNHAPPDSLGQEFPSGMPKDSLDQTLPDTTMLKKEKIPTANEGDNPPQTTDESPPKPKPR